MVNSGKRVTGKRKGQVTEDANAPGRHGPEATEDVSSAPMIMEISFKGYLRLLFHIFFLQVS